MEVGGLLKGVSGVQERAFFEVVADELQPDRHAAMTQARRHAHARQPGQAGRQGEDVRLACLQHGHR